MHNEKDLVISASTMVMLTAIVFALLLQSYLHLNEMSIRIKLIKSDSKRSKVYALFATQ